MRLAVPGPGAYVVSVLVIALAVASGWWAGTLRPDTKPALTSALDVIPARTTVVGFTHWAAIRDHLDLGDVDTRGERADLVAEAAERDLSTRSVFGRSEETMYERFGWSPAEIEWEVYGQDPVGAANVVRLDASVSFDDLRAKLRAADYRQRGETWSVAETPGLPGILAHVALVPRQRLVVMSDRREQVPDVLDVVDGRARSLARVHAAAGTAQALAASDSVILQAGTLGCESTAVADEDRAQQARAAVERAGGLAEYRFSGRGILERGGSGFPAQRLVFAMTFDSAVVASDQARVRSRLSTGPFIGRTGPVSDTLRLDSASADDTTVRLAFDHDPDTDVFMPGTGPALFASC